MWNRVNEENEAEKRPIRLKSRHAWNPTFAACLEIPACHVTLKQNTTQHNTTHPLSSHFPLGGVPSLTSHTSHTLPSSLSHIPLHFFFYSIKATAIQEAKEFIDKEDPRPTSSNGAYIMWYQEHLHLGDFLLLPLSLIPCSSSYYPCISSIVLWFGSV